MKRPIDQEFLNLLSQARSALNTAVRFKVGDTDSYAIAAQIDRALDAVEARPLQTFIVTASVSMREVWEIRARDEAEARETFEEGTLLRSDSYEPGEIIYVELVTEKNGK